MSSLGYKNTANYGFKKPDATNVFSVNDLNNALDAIDGTIKESNDDLSAYKTETDSVLDDVVGNDVETITIEDGNEFGEVIIKITKKSDEVVQTQSYRVPVIGASIWRGWEEPIDAKEGDIWIRGAK